MSKKILLRRPKCSLKDTIHDSISPPKTSELELRTSSFKEEIQQEIERLDQEHFNNDINKQNDIELIETANFSYKSENITKSKHDKCSVVSVWSINDGLLPIKESNKIPNVDKSRKADLSAKTVNIFDRDNQISQIELQSEVYCHNLFKQTESSLPLPTQTIPRHIIIIQIAALLKRQLSDDMNKEVGCTIITMPKRPHNMFQKVPKFEIVLYENDNFANKDSIMPHEISEILQQKLITSDRQGGYRQINDDQSEDDISATEVSMMECHMTGKHHLQLAAHSISEVPNLKNVFPNLTSIDISYNNFKIIPPEIVELPLLEELNVRNNPIQSIPDNIAQMNNLRVLICSFTRVSRLPTSVFQCPNLQEMDLSYNIIDCIPHVTSIHKLKTLHLSGNPIRYFKKSFGRLHLEKLSLTDTWTNPVFWPSGDFTPSRVDRTWSFCDLCEQPLGDLSLSSVSFSRKFGHILPIIMSFCSSLCKITLMPEGSR